MHRAMVRRMILVARVLQVMVPLVMEMVGVLEVMVWFLPEDPDISIRNCIVVGGGGAEGGVGDAPCDGATVDAYGEVDAKVEGLGRLGWADGEGVADGVAFDGASGDVDGEGAAGGDGLGCTSARGLLMACFRHGSRHSWQRVSRALLAGLSAGLGGVCRLRCCGDSSLTLAEGAVGEVDGEGARGDAVYSVSGDVDGEGAVGDVLGGGGAGDADGEGAAVGATVEGAAGVADGEGVAGEAAGVGVAGDANGEGGAVDALADAAVGVAFGECSG